MKYQELKIGNLTVPKPIVQGGMGIGVSLGRLAGAVAKEGGIGIISAAQIGFREADFADHTKAANLRAMQKEMNIARDIAPNGVIGFNIMVAMRYYEDYVRGAVEAGADVIISGAGLPTDLPKFVAGSDVKIAPIVSTEKSANVILKYWDKKYGRTADMIVIEGPKAGGHLGFDRKHLEKYAQDIDKADYDEGCICDAGCVCDEGCSCDAGCAYDAGCACDADCAYDTEIIRIMQVVKDYERKYGIQIPVVLAGGITDAKDAAHAFGLGADAIQVATRFVTTEECDADSRFKECYIQADKEDIVIVQSPVGMPGRAILNPFMKLVMDGVQFASEKCFGCLRKCNPKDIPYCITQALVNAVNGNVDEGLVFCGANAWKARKIEKVKEVIDSLLEDCV